jgi:hypothetical protein
MDAAGLGLAAGDAPGEEDADGLAAAGPSAAVGAERVAVGGGADAGVAAEHAVSIASDAATSGTMVYRLCRRSGAVGKAVEDIDPPRNDGHMMS